MSVRTELLIDDQWTDVTTSVRYDQGITIRRGRQDEQARVAAGACALNLDNRTGTFSPRNPAGAYFGKIGRNTPIRIPITAVSDAFGRTTSNGWGSTDTGEAWTTVGGAASDFSVGSGVGAISVTAVNSIREVHLASMSVRAGAVACTFTVPAVATGAPINMGVTCRRADSSNYYIGNLRFTTTGLVAPQIRERVADVDTALATGSSMSYTAGTTITLELTFDGQYLALRAWKPSSPTSVSTASVLDPSLSAAGSIGVYAFLDSGNTNTLPLSLTYDSFRLDDMRFHGEVTAWPSTWDPTGRDVQAQVEASGIMRRLAQASALQSAYRRFVDFKAATSVAFVPVAYWPLEDASGSTQAASGLSGGAAMKMFGTVTFAADNTLGGSGSLPSIAATGTPTNGVGSPVAPMTITVGAGWTINFWTKATGTNAEFSPLVIVDNTGVTWRVTAENTGTATCRVDVIDPDGTTTAFTRTVNVLDGDWHFIVLNPAQTSSTDVQVVFSVDSVNTVGFLPGSRTLGGTLRLQTPSLAAMTNITSAYVGHLAVYATNTSTDWEQAAITAGGGHDGETAGARMQRLCDEEDIVFVPAADYTGTEPVGPQRIATLLDLFHDAADADQGILYEPRTVVGIAFRPRDSMYNQSTTLALDYGAQHMRSAPTPVDDDQKTRNDVTVARLNGSSARSTVTTGALSTQAPPDGVGVYPYAATLAVQSDAQCADLAGWIAHIGTVDEPRYPALEVQLHRHTTLVPTARGVDLGDVITVANLPSFLPPDTASALVQGYTERLTEDAAIKRSITWNTSPSSPYQTIGVVDTVGSDLYAAVNSTATTWDVATTGTSTVTSRPAPRWTTAAADLPFDLKAAGERVTVTNVANGTWTFIAAGTAATDANASGSATLSPGLPAGLATGHLLLCMASIRNSGTGSPNTPTGYTRLPIFPSGANVQLFAKIAGGSESAPTVSFADGVANADIIAQTAAFSSSLGINSVSSLVMHAAPVLNASAADISYPRCPVPEDNCLILYLGWKQDDWTSVATIASATEIGEPDTAAGNDAGQVWDYVIQTTKADIAAGSFTVTGGASAISRGAVAALRVDVQRMTVTRSVNSVVKSQVVDEAISLWTPATVGL